MEIATSLGIGRVRIFDLQILLMARESGARQIWTHDANFKAIPGIAAIDPPATIY